MAARRRLMWVVLAFLVFSVLFWVSSIIITDKKESITRHMSILDHLGQTASRTFITSQLPTRRKVSTYPVREPNCRPHDNVVFIKTHKTASSTTSGIFDHYAYKKNLTLAVPPDGAPYMDRKELFRRDMIAKTKDVDGWKKEDGFNMMTAHARYNRREMDAVVPNAKYITIIRDPRAQFVSTFVFFNFVYRFERIFESRGEKYGSAIEGFLKNPVENYRLMSHRLFSHVLWNQQMFDMGLDTTSFNDAVAIEEMIAKLDRELDLVMITEYYDESLLLLRDMLCWDTEDVLYTQRLVRNSSQEISVDDATRNKISQWNTADTMLYDHFNKTLWERIAAYGPSFQDELRIFRQQLAETTPRKTGHHSRDTRKIIKRMKDRGILIR